jgi:hypothetical protein
MEVPEGLIRPDTYDFLSAPDEDTRIPLDLGPAKLAALFMKIVDWRQTSGRAATEDDHPFLDGPDGNDVQNAILWDVHNSLAPLDTNIIVVEGFLWRVDLKLRDFTKEVTFLHVLYSNFGRHVLDEMKIHKTDQGHAHELDGDRQLENEVLEVVYRRAAREWYDPYLYRCICQQVAYDKRCPEALGNPAVREEATRLGERRGWGPTDIERLV